MMFAMAGALTTIDVFAGAGGLSLGFEQAGFVPVLGVDADKRAKAAYAANFPAARTLDEDIADLTGGDLLDAAGLRSCAVVIGGPPCQAFSVGGLRRQDDGRRGLVPEFGRVVREIGPDYFVMENVPGILMPAARGILDAFRLGMGRAGYALSEPWLLDAAAFGVPQRRRRLFLVGAKRGLSLPPQPAPSGDPPPTARDAIGDLEQLEACLLGPRGGHAGKLGAASPYAARLRDSTDDPADRSDPRPAPAVLTGCARVHHSKAVAARFGRARQGAQEPISRFYRLHPRLPSRTIRAGTLDGHGSHTAPRPIHYDFPRCITVREAARLQSMPDWFQADPDGGTQWRGFMQVGNAVPPLLARAVANAIRRAALREGSVGA